MERIASTRPPELLRFTVHGMGYVVVRFTPSPVGCEPWYRVYRHDGEEVGGVTWSAAAGWDWRSLLPRVLSRLVRVPESHIEDLVVLQ